jgi:chemotaxis receptor (MCP) glutamine deamidase CheD
MAFDEKNITDALSYLEERGINVIRTSLYQLKSGAVNYYPSKGTIFIDGVGRLSQRGLAAFERVVKAVEAGSVPWST